MTNEFPRLTSDDGVDDIALKSVHVEGRLDGLLLRVRARQCFRNDSDCNLEAIYTFPAPWNATLLGMVVEIGDKRMQGVVLEKSDAEARYEDAIDQGDTPVMVQRAADGLYTANLGNLRPADDVVIELEYAQLLRFDHGRIRLTLPTTIAPRYGEPLLEAGLPMHASVESSLMVEYPFTLKLRLSNWAGRAEVTSPSHAISCNRSDEDWVVALADEGYLDRDFVLMLGNMQSQAFTLAAPDGDQWAVLASFCPQVPSSDEVPLAVKILLDCSGSMAGDSIRCAKSGLRRALGLLSPQDRVSFSRFGTKVIHEYEELQQCGPELKEAMFALISETEADMGGTEIGDALRSAILSVERSSQSKPPQDVLLITDGLVWNADLPARSCLDFNHRIFAIGVGSAPAESLLRELAERTGGYCELVSGAESIEDAVARQFQRMKEARTADAKVILGVAPTWQSRLPLSVFNDQTIHVFARLRRLPDQAPILSWQLGGQECRQTVSIPHQSRDGEMLARMAAATRIRESERVRERKRLALHYQLLSEHTSLFLVHEREKGDKAEGLPRLQKIAQMHAAGAHGVGSAVFEEHPVVYCLDRRRAAGEVKRDKPNAAWLRDYLARIKQTIAERFARKGRARAAAGSEKSPIELLQMLDWFANEGASLSQFIGAARGVNLPRELEKVLRDAARENAEIGWAIFMSWLAKNLRHEYRLSRHAERLIRMPLAGADENWKGMTEVLFAVVGAWVAADSWGVLIV